VPLQQAAAQFPLRHPAIHTLVVGLNSINEYNQTVTALDTSLPTGLWAELSSLGLINDPARS
jgi:D-threo-aldose 1-dehydrogenase